MKAAAIITESAEKKAQRRFWDDPYFFQKEVLGRDPHDHQIKIMESIRDNRITAVKSCHASGKDWTAGGAVPWFLLSNVPSKVITTAPTDRQVRLILWQEIGEAYGKAKYHLGGLLLQQEWKLDKNWFAVGFAAPDYDPDSFQGFHSENIFLIYDEANGISASIRAGGRGIMSGGRRVRLLEIGNPTNPHSEFAKQFRLPHVNKLSICAYDLPNFTTFGITEADMVDGSWRGKIGDAEMPATYLISPEWVAETIAEYGTRDRFYVSRVLGEFPSEVEDALFEYDLIRAAMDRPFVGDGETELACDVARKGSDSTVIAKRVGLSSEFLDIMRGEQRTTEISGRLIRRCREDATITAIKIDDDGVGGGVTDELVAAIEDGSLSRNVRIYAMRGGTASTIPRATNDSPGFVNARAEWHWNLKTYLENSPISLPNDDKLMSQMAQIERQEGTGGRIKVQSKEDFKKVIGYSPDEMDTIVYLYNYPTDREPEVQVFV
jgi:hypothetical protein